MTLPISVVLCSYNGSRFIEEQVRSILLQTHPVTELIIADDMSSDNTVELAEKMAREDPRIRIICNTQNLGYTANFENVLQQASCELIAIADQDDVWHEKKIEILLSQFSEKASLIYCDSVRFHHSVPANPVANKKNRRIAGSDPKKIAMFNTISGHAMIIRRSLLKEALPFPQGVYYDWWLSVVAMCTDAVEYVPQVLVYQRAHDANVTIHKDVTEAELRRRFRVMLNTHLDFFKGVKKLSDADRNFFVRLHKLWNGSLTHKMNWRLFVFLLQHRQDLYFYKVRKIAFFSQFKNSFLFSFRA